MRYNIERVAKQYTIERVANMIFITDESGQVWKAWDEYDFTERKLSNAIKKISNCHNCKVTFTRTF